MHGDTKIKHCHCQRLVLLVPFEPRVQKNYFSPSLYIRQTSCNRVILEKPKFSQLVKFLTFYEKRVHYPDYNSLPLLGILNQINPVHPFPLKSCVHFSSPPYMPHAYMYSLILLPEYYLVKVQIMKITFMHFSSALFVPLRLNYVTEHLMCETKFHRNKD